MTNDELSIPDRLYFGIKAIPSWYGVLSDAEDSLMPSRKRTVGSIVSSVLLAAGDDEEPIALGGVLDDDGSGRLVVFYRSMIVTADAKHLISDIGTYETRIWPLDRVSDLIVETGHSYYDGTEQRPRHTNFAFRFTLDGQQLRIAPQSAFYSSPLVKDEAIYRAFTALRDWLTRR